MRGATETYTYDASGSRVSRTHDGMTTLYFGSYEVDRQGTTTTLTSRYFYAFGGQGVAQCEVTGGANTLVYLHGDHLGSTGAVTDTTGAVRGGPPFRSSAPGRDGWRG